MADKQGKAVEALEALARYAQHGRYGTGDDFNVEALREDLDGEMEALEE